MDQHPQHMKISELSRYAKIPATTIRFYIQQELMPPPLKTTKKMAYYSKVHLDRLFKIQEMKEKNLSLSTIRDILTDDDVEPVPEESSEVLMTSSREEILNAAVKVFREKGYDNVTIANIASAARISKGTFYKYFRNKEELFYECLENIFYDIGMDIPELKTENDGLKRLFLRGRNFNRYVGNILGMLNLARYKAFVNSDQFKEKWDKAIFNFIEPIRKDLELIIQQRQSPLTKSELVAYLLMGAVEYGYYYASSHDTDPREIEKAFWKLFFASDLPQIKKEDN